MKFTQRNCNMTVLQLQYATLCVKFTQLTCTVLLIQYCLFIISLLHACIHVMPCSISGGKSYFFPWKFTYDEMWHLAETEKGKFYCRKNGKFDIIDYAGMKYMAQITELPYLFHVNDHSTVISMQQTRGLHVATIPQTPSPSNLSNLIDKGGWLYLCDINAMQLHTYVASFIQQLQVIHSSLYRCKQTL